MRADNPVVRWRKAGLAWHITTLPSSCLRPIWPDYVEPIMTSLCYYCKLHNCIWTNQEINLSPPCSCLCCLCVVSSKCDINGARVINDYKSRHNDPIEPVACPCRPSQGEPQDMIYISTRSHAGNPHRGLMVFYCHRFQNHLLSCLDFPQVLF